MLYSSSNTSQARNRLQRDPRPAEELRVFKQFRLNLLRFLRLSPGIGESTLRNTLTEISPGLAATYARRAACAGSTWASTCRTEPDCDGDRNFRSRIGRYVNFEATPYDAALIFESTRVTRKNSRADRNWTQDRRRRRRRREASLSTSLALGGHHSRVERLFRGAELQGQTLPVVHCSSAAAHRMQCRALRLHIPPLRGSTRSAAPC